uniref:Uncharacterized protein MANES_01G013500 n=1 Tax=Rhizophora mucronata TaxID=61149 RepID=A0A2P2LRG9_RHIMU
MLYMYDQLDFIDEVFLSQAVSGIALPLRSDKLYSSSHDGTVRVWDCHTGQLTRTINLGDKIGSLISKGPWVFVGMPNMVKAWNIETAVDFSLGGPAGQVYAMVVAVETDMLFAGAQDGVISAWKGRSGDPNSFQMAASLKGHKGAVLCLAVESGRIFSGSLDGTIRVWDLDSFQCIHMLNGHTDAVTSLIFWNQYLLSCSLDHTIKVWVDGKQGSMEVTYSHEEKHGALALCGINDAEGKPVLLCSCNNNVVCLYELPSFREKGRIFSKREVRTMQTGPGGLFFTGDGTGMLTVWKLAESKGRSPVA